MHGGHPSRRQFLAASCAWGLTALESPARLWAQPRFSKNPFTLGVASGDPAPDGFVLWTRLAPEPLSGGGMPNEAVPVEWVLAADEKLRRIVRKGKQVAVPALAHSVHVEVQGLEPGRWYYYQFRCGGAESPIGRTRTAPKAGAGLSRLRFAFASCQHYEAGYYTAYQHMAEEDLDFVVHLGDYIYEGGVNGRIRKHNSAEIVSLNDYRNRYALYKSDELLQRAHARFPWIVTWDDHEVDNDYANDHPEDNQPRAAFLERRANAYQAYYEHMPLRRSALPKGANMQLYRSMGFGALADFFVLDTRQYRSPQPCGGRGPLCAQAFAPGQSIMGAAQEKWLMQRLASSKARWKVIAQQVMMAALDLDPGAAEFYSMDKWNGYAGERKRLLEFIADRKISNLVVVTGDIHSNWAAELKPDFGSAKSPVVGAEFVGTSISSGGDGMEMSERMRAALGGNPHIRFHNAQRGYVRCTASAERWESDYRVVPFVSKPGAPIATRASFVVESGKAGLQRNL